MLLFMFLLLPVVLIGYCFYKRDAKITPAIFLGGMAGILLCAFKTFFLYAHRIIPYSIQDNVVYLVIRQGLLPVCVVYALFLVFSRDKLSYRGGSAFPLLISFYMIYLPYSIVTTAEGLYSAYSIFVKPILFLAMLVQFSYCAKKVFYCIEEKKYLLISVFVILAILYLLVPSFVEAYSIVNEKTGIQVIISICYCLVPVLILTFPLVKKLIKK